MPFGIYRPAFKSPTEQAQQVADLGPQEAITIPVESAIDIYQKFAKARENAGSTFAVLTHTLHITPNKNVFVSRSALAVPSQMLGFDWQGLLQTVGQVAGTALQFAPLLLAQDDKKRVENNELPSGVAVGLDWLSPDDPKLYAMQPAGDPAITYQYYLQHGVAKLKGYSVGQEAKGKIEALAAGAFLQTPSCLLNAGISAVSGLLLQSLPAASAGWTSFLKSTLANGGEATANMIQAVQSC